MLAGVIALAPGAGTVAAQQDEVPILKPKAKLVTAATLLVMCDLACDWTLDGEKKGHIEAGRSAKEKTDFGQHEVAGTTLDGLDKVESSLDVKEAGQTIVHIALQPVRNARLQTEQSAREEAAYLQDLRDHAADRFKKGSALAEQKRYGEARPLFQKACDGGDMVGCFDLALLYDNGDGGSQDYSQARTLYQRSCDGGYIDGCTNAGSLYAQGRGGSQDYFVARMFYQKACDGGDMLGCVNLGKLYDNGNGGSQDYSQGRTLFQKACESGNIEGCSNLGGLYYYGHGVKQDYSQARTFDQKACDGGVMGACFMLGLYYENGYGGRKDYAMALTLFQKACDGGEPDGCTHLQSQH
jgi:hypothetical protein